MSVYKRGDVWWFDFTARDGVRHRGSTKQRGKAAALRVEARERERAELGEVSRPIPTLKEAADAWFASKVEGRKSAKTVAIRVEIALRAIGPDVLVSTIDTPDIENAIQARRVEATRHGKAPANATVNRDLVDTTLRPILRYCRTILKVPVQEIDWRGLRLVEPKGRSRTFTLDELMAWRGALPEHHRPVFDFIAAYGVRLGEAFFPLDSFDPDTGVITIRERKNGLPHAIRLLPDQAMDLTARLGRARDAGLDTVWFHETKRGLRAITPRGFQSASRAALEATRTADARPVHDLRHHAASAFLRLPGASLKHVQRLLGHESITSTARYAHVSTDDVFNVMRQATEETPEAGTPRKRNVP